MEDYPYSGIVKERSLLPLVLQGRVRLENDQILFLGG